MSQQLVCRVTSCRRRGHLVRADRGPLCGRHASMGRELSFEDFRKKQMLKSKTAKAAAARVKAMVPPPERLLGSFIASTTKAGPVTGVVSARGTGKQAHLLVASFEGIVRTLKGSTIESGNVLYQKLTEGANLLGYVAAPGHEDKRKVFAKYLATLPTFSQIGETRVTALSETSTKALVVYSE